MQRYTWHVHRQVSKASEVGNRARRENVFPRHEGDGRGYPDTGSLPKYEAPCVFTTASQVQSRSCFKSAGAGGGGGGKDSEVVVEGKLPVPEPGRTRDGCCGG